MAETVDMEHNECKTCGAKDGRAGILIDDECQNCYQTRRKGAVVVHTNLVRSESELKRTMQIISS